MIIYFYIWKHWEGVNYLKMQTNKHNKKLLKLTEELERITFALKEVILAMTPEQREEMYKKMQEKKN